MYHSSINLLDIRAFVLVANMGNFTKAAEALGVSRSHVSRQIQSLEKQMGVSLIIRTTRSMKLTDAGLSFLSSCDQALHTIDKAVHTAVDDTETIRGNIKINCVGGYLGEEVVAVAVAQFLNAYPDVTIELDFSSHRVDLLEEEFDLAIRMGDLADASYVARRLTTIEMQTLASPVYLANNPALTHPKQLKEHKCITGSVKKWHFEHIHTAESIEVPIESALSCKNGRVLVNAAKQGVGLIRVPAVYCEEEIRQGVLVPVFEDWRIRDVPLSLIYHKDRFQPNRIRACVNHLIEAFKDT
ncbi:LysR family transcriptional regulator [Vibrio maritimus]|uniref:LysR family transcriptional regulator n=1 Tax=Vibrio maritimus TaxID=990268 RepID=UPI001F30FA1E|nr:LysR family transcriptional regulator [Vibrio maritimus]